MILCFKKIIVCLDIGPPMIVGDDGEKVDEYRQNTKLMKRCPYLLTTRLVTVPVSV